MTMNQLPAAKRLCVLKFGSSVLETESDYAAVANECYRHVRDGEKVVAVVSALAGETDALLNKSRELRDPVERKKVFDQIAARVIKERPVVYLYHVNWLWAYNAKLSGVRNIPDGLLRVSGLKLAP